MEVSQASTHHDRPTDLWFRPALLVPQLQLHPKRRELTSDPSPYDGDTANKDEVSSFLVGRSVNHWLKIYSDTGKLPIHHHSHHFQVPAQ